MISATQRNRLFAPKAKIKVCYLAGKMRGIPLDNFPEFHRAAATLRKDGWTVISPAEMDEAAADQKPEPNSSAYAGWLRRVVRRDMEAILSLRAENGDAIITLPGWTTSDGAMAELRTGKWLGLDLLRFIWNTTGDVNTYVLFPWRERMGYTTAAE